MDSQTQAAIARVVDKSIAKVATKSLDELRQHMSKQEIAESIRSTILSYKNLQHGQIPSYQRMDALYYAVWYQPARINLAFTLARQMPESANPISANGGDLRVVDFGAGEFAMQFGLALAAAEVHLDGKQCPRIGICNVEPSSAMWTTGRSLWEECLSEVRSEEQELPQLTSLRYGFRRLEFRTDVITPKFRWLTVLHVAYKDSYTKIKLELDELVAAENPDAVLVTSNPGANNWAYVPPNDVYSKVDSKVVVPSDLFFEGKYFKSCTEFRRKLFQEFFVPTPPEINEDDFGLVKSFLNSPTTWDNDGHFSAEYSVYTKKLV